MAGRSPHCDTCVAPRVRRSVSACRPGDTREAEHRTEPEGTTPPTHSSTATPQNLPQEICVNKLSLRGKFYDEFDSIAHVIYSKLSTKYLQHSMWYPKTDHKQEGLSVEGQPRINKKAFQWKVNRPLSNIYVLHI